MLIALFTILFLNGGSASPFIVPKAEKLVKEVIQDEAKKDSILNLMAEYNDDAKALQKEKVTQLKEIKKIIEDQDSDLNQVSKIFQGHRDKRNAFNQKLITNRSIILGLLTDDEKAALSKLIKEKFEENKETYEKNAKKTIDKATKKLTEVEKDIMAAYDDPEKQIEAGKLLTAFSTDMIRLVDQNNQYAKQTLETSAGLNNGHQDSLSELVYQVETYRAEAHTSFLLLYQGLVKITPPDDWSKVATPLKKLL